MPSLKFWCVMTLFRWVFKQLYDKGLVYRGVKVMPFSTACNTPLSNFESHQNYKVGAERHSRWDAPNATTAATFFSISFLQDVQDPSVIVNFPLVENEDVALIAWTTTPWTLPSNLALCVNPEMLYVKVKGKKPNFEILLIWIVILNSSACIIRCLLQTKIIWYSVLFCFVFF